MLQRVSVRLRSTSKIVVPPGSGMLSRHSLVTPCLASMDNLILKVTFIQHCRKKKNLIVPAESEICFPLAYSAGVVLWNMMQIWD